MLQCFILYLKMCKMCFLWLYDTYDDIINKICLKKYYCPKDITNNTVNFLLQL